MTFEEYYAHFQTIIETPLESQNYPYDNAEYIEYTKLNWTRMNRWLKNGKLSDELKEVISRIDEPQEWIVITEPWCGDAGQIIPFFELASKENALITVNYELRDKEPHRINDYLTNGSKSIPKLIVKNRFGEDLATWGPRPQGCSVLYQRLIAEKEEMELIKVEIQKWYNHDKGVEIQQELVEIIKV